MDYAKQISAYVEQHKAEMLAALQTIINLEGHPFEKANVDKVQDWVRAQFEQEGFQCFVHEVAPDRTGILVGILGADRPGKPVLFSGHLDTVFHKGAFGGPNPFRREGDKVYGPGVNDMKAGVIMTLFVVKALNALGWRERPLKIMFVGEEEADHIGNQADVYLTEQSRGMLCAFNMEGGDTKNRLALGHKSQLTYYLKVHGVGGHAGCDFLTGKNAITEMVGKLSEICKLTDLAKGTTVTPSTIKGGLHVCGIPAECEATVDIRIDTVAEHKRITELMDQLLQQNFIPGTSTEYHVDVARFKPYKENPGISALHHFACEAAQGLGLPAFGKTHSGGAADSGNIAFAGVPVLCGCGIMGGSAHSLKEFALLPSMYDRTKVWALVVTRLAAFTIDGNVKSEN